MCRSISAISSSSIEAERWQAFASVPFGLVIYVLAHYGTYRARRYRATRTTFRGVRLWMTGSGWSYAGRAILWDIVTVLSLGLALPWRAALLERFKMRHTHFGDLEGSFAGTGWGFFKRGWWLWLLFLLPLTACCFLERLPRSTCPRRRFAGRRNRTAAASIGFAVLLWLPVLMFGFPLYRAIELRWWLEGIRFGDVAMTSTLRKRSILWCYVKAMLVGGVTMGVLGILLQVGMQSAGVSLEDLRPPQTPSVTMWHHGRLLYDQPVGLGDSSVCNS